MQRYPTNVGEEIFANIDQSHDPNIQNAAKFVQMSSSDIIE